MNSDMLWQLGLFVLILMVLNTMLALNISIIGSVVLTVGMSSVFDALRRR